MPDAVTAHRQSRHINAATIDAGIIAPRLDQRGQRRKLLNPITGSRALRHEDESRTALTPGCFDQLRRQPAQLLLVVIPPLTGTVQNNQKRLRATCGGGFHQAVQKSGLVRMVS